jgi:MerR family redox-sensitive transcriptional activator SoxR
VRFYEKQGLVSSVRTAGNQRRFHHADGCLIKIVRVAQRVGLSMAEIRELMSELPEDRGLIGPPDFLRLRIRLESEVRQRIQALNEVLDDLDTDQKLCELPPVQGRNGWRIPVTAATLAR